MTPRLTRYYSRRTQERRLNALLQEIQDHPHREELLQLISAQVKDDLN